MKRYMCCVMFICLLGISGCSRIETDVSNGKKDPQSTINDNSYNIYQITGDTDLFDETIDNNPIDKEYTKEFYSDAETTEELKNIQVKYLNIWQDELANAVESYTKCLSSAEKASFSVAQSQWKKSFDDNFSFESQILRDADNGIELGYAFDYLFLSEQREAVRNRTIRIKYLHFLLESSRIDPDLPENYESLKFIYKS